MPVTNKYAVFVSEEDQFPDSIYGLTKSDTVL